MNDQEKQSIIPDHHDLDAIVAAAYNAWIRGNNAGHSQCIEDGRTIKSNLLHKAKDADDVDIYYDFYVERYIAVGNWHGLRSVDISDDLLERGVITVIPLTEQEKQKREKQKKEEELLLQHANEEVVKICKKFLEVGIKISNPGVICEAYYGIVDIQGATVSVRVSAHPQSCAWGGPAKHSIEIHTGSVGQCDYSLPEGKDGFNYAKLADTVKACIAEETQLKIQAKKDHEAGQLTEEELKAAITAIVCIRKHK